MTGKVFKALSGSYYIEDDDGQVIDCKARGRLKNEGISPLVGDIAEYIVTDGGKGMIEKILPRKNSFTRPAIANLDQMVIIVSAVIPVSDPFLIDRMTVIAEYKDVEPIICINKTDMDTADDLFLIYSAAGFKTIRTSAETGDGVDGLIELIRGNTAAFTGNSGVGKSSLLNMIEPNFSIKVNEVSRKLGRGKHTTRHVELYKLSCGATVADTPGFSSFDTQRMEQIMPDQMAFYFPDFEPYIYECRFTGCSHTKEKGCEVLSALDAGRIQKTRHESYLRLLEAAREIKPWEV